MGIEPTSEAWEASILPLYDARSLDTVAKHGKSGKTGSTECLVTETVQQVIVHQAGGLHQGVTNRGANETEATFL